MIINIDDNWRIRGVERTWFVEHFLDREHKEGCWRPKAEFEALERAYSWVFERELRLLPIEIDPDALVNVFDALRQVEDDIKSAIVCLNVEGLATD